MKYAVLFVAGLSVLGTAAKADCDRKAGQSIATRLSKEISVVVKFTSAQCTVTAENGKCTLLCLSDRETRDLDRSILLTFIASSAGKKIKSAGTEKFENVAFADREMLSRNRALKISASRAASIYIDPAETPPAAARRVEGYFTEFDFRRTTPR